MKPIFIVGNLIWISIEVCDTFGSKEPLYMLCGRHGGLVPNAIMTGLELKNRWPDGVFLNGINASDTVTFNDK